jgi:hypothetical protein
MPGRAVDVREHRFITATQNVAYDWYQSGVWYTTQDGDETETHYPAGMYLDRFSATQTPGLLLLHGRGNVFVRDLAQGQTICVHPGAFVWKDASVSMRMHLERPKSGSWFMRWQPATPWIRIMGPGRVAVSSAYEHMEGTGRIVNTSGASIVDWNYQHPQNVGGGGGGVTVLGGPQFNDAPLKAALDAFAAAQGFTVDADRGSIGGHVHQYTHAAGISVVLAVADAGGAAATIASVATRLGGVGGGLGGALQGRLTQALANAQSSGGGGNGQGQPIEGLGFPAHWNQTAPTSSTLVVTKNGKVVTVKLVAQIPPGDQLAWEQAFAAAALPTI